MSFAAFGAAVGAYATIHWNLDLGLSLLLAGLVGAAVAVVVGLPALRLKGFFLAVTTLAFALATSAYLLNVQHFAWVPDPNTVVTRPHLFGALDVTSQRTYYWVCVGVLALTVLAVRGIRRGRTGRVLLALRENERGAQAYGINILRAKLTAFAISGFLAAVGGCLLVHLLGRVQPRHLRRGPELHRVHRRSGRWPGLATGRRPRLAVPEGRAVVAAWRSVADPGFGRGSAAGADGHPRRDR